MINQPDRAQTPHLRRAQPGDAAAVEALLVACRLPTAGAAAHLRNFYVATVGAEIVAAAGMEHYGSVALLRSVAVDPAHRGRGLAQQLVQDLLHDARRRNVQQVWLLTTTAAGFFDRFGFTAVATAAAPKALQASAEFQGACPASAQAMRLYL